jgi:hypothetical protein
MALLTAQTRGLLESDALAHLVTLNPDGSPQVSCVWVGVDGDARPRRSTIGACASTWSSMAVLGWWRAEPVPSYRTWPTSTWDPTHFPPPQFLAPGFVMRITLRSGWAAWAPGRMYPLERHLRRAVQAGAPSRRRVSIRLKRWATMPH